MNLYTPSLLLIGLLFPSLLVYSQAGGEWNRGGSMEDEVVSRLSFLDKNGSLQNYVTVSAEGVRLYSSPKNKFSDLAEFHLYPEEYEAFRGMAKELSPEELIQVYKEKGTRRWPNSIIREYAFSQKWVPSKTRSLPLQGLKVALDPGHLGGDMEEAELEGKYVKVRASASYEGMEFWEGNLTLATAHLVRKKLELLGATVMMTRERPGQTSMGSLYKDWRKNEFLKSVDQEVRAGRLSRSKARFWKTEATERDIYRRFFNILDLRERARKINAFNPDITLIIHYNVDKDNWDNRDGDGYFKPGFANYSMAFVPGSLTTSNVRRMEGRVNFLRLLVSSSASESVRLSELYLKANALTTGVPIVERNNEPDYLENFCVPTYAQGVYSRDLALTRLIKGPLCYGESLCQDNWRELLWLNKRDLEVEGIPVSSRVKHVAEAYVIAIKQFVGI